MVKLRGTTTPTSAYCSVCKISFPKVRNYTQHIKSATHKRNENDRPNKSKDRPRHWKKGLIDLSLSLPAKPTLRSGRVTKTCGVNTRAGAAGPSAGTRKSTKPRTSTTLAVPPSYLEARMVNVADRHCRICDHTYATSNGLKVHYETRKHKEAAGNMPGNLARQDARTRQSKLSPKSYKC